jgi:hypothetical protein
VAEVSAPWETLLPYFGNAGFAGLWLASHLFGWIVTSKEADRIESERDQWKDLYLKECEAHERTRDALRLASSRGDATVDALQLVAGAINAVRAQADREMVPEATSLHGERDSTGETGRRKINRSGRERRGDPA